ncbi:EAL domain-containing protein [Halomonas campisalis]|uniref:EAL domain-containing protein n=1 Tax=Billgrantia campisalis TaxID=74661 RepID=A0ABS9PDH8_9GAMM|nr:EAL domain-containing protein [Halomonas campisalis]MCG6659781.1 EAL domain-containing protein [Halomonas campisalis]MDR5864935.1 EAL domain-containing protein [Halomonas campisalis]
MDEKHDVSGAGPRGQAAAAWRPVASEGAGDTDDTRRILLLMEGRGNRQQLEKQLSARYRVVHLDKGQLPAEDFDLAIADAPALKRWQDELFEAKNAQQPVLLPVMLMLPRAELRSRAGRLRSLVDDFVISPIDRTEFLERVEILLRTRHQAQAQRDELVRIVNYDRATSLPNRNLFHEQVRTAMVAAKAKGESVHIVAVHTPLTRVFETFGQRGLDQAAAACAERFCHLAGEDVGLARLGIEGWGAMLHDDASPLDRVIPLCTRLGKLDRRSIEVAGESIHLKARIGIASYPNDGSDAETVINAANIAAAQANEGEPAFYSADRRAAMLHHLRTEAALHDALKQEQFELWLQPKLALADNRVVGAEALIRWRLPSGELVPPGRFIPVAESTGFIRRITPWVLATACRIAAALRADGERDFVLAVNVTPADLDADFAERLQALCAQHALPPQAIELELTETMFCETSTDIIDRLRTLREAGFGIAIDDFGTGYSSLSYLHQLPVDTLKIDKQFVDGVPGVEGSDTVTRAIIHLAREFGLETVAEGIENEEQLAYLRAAGVGLGQGFHIARPMPAADFAGWLAKWKTHSPSFSGA